MGFDSLTRENGNYEIENVESTFCHVESLHGSITVNSTENMVNIDAGTQVIQRLTRALLLIH